MAITMSSLTSSFASLSFTSQISPKPNSLSLSFTKPTCSTLTKKHSPLLVAANATVAAVDTQTEDLKKFVKATLPGGFAAQTLWGTGRRKSAIARVVLKEGTGKVIINYRDAKFPKKVLGFSQEVFPPPLVFSFIKEFLDKYDSFAQLVAKIYPSEIREHTICIRNERPLGIHVKRNYPVDECKIV